MFLIGTAIACIDTGPLFPADELGADAGGMMTPSGLGGEASGGASGAPSSPSPDGEGGDGGDQTPPNEGAPTPDGPIDAPPNCEASDAGLPRCGGDPLGEDPSGEDPPDEDPPSEDPEDPAEPPDEDPPASDACDECLAGVCPETIARCDDTEGCDAIVACARESGCEQDACYCGDVNALLCTTTGQANGPCRDVMLAAPGAHLPSFVEPNAGPASVAASDVGTCRVQSADCRDVCDD